MLELELIRIDGGTQSRVELSQETVAEYAEAYKAGAKFPPVVVFYDGTHRWLADGFHRYFGAKAAGLSQIYESVTPGTLRDAILYSLRANAEHGLNRTNADKRKAVTTMLADPEWSAWSDRKIAEAVGVSVPFVGSIRRPEVKEQQQKNRAASAARKAEDCNPITPSVKPQAAAKAPKKDAEDIEYFGPSEEEIAEAEAAAADDTALLRKLIDADDKLAAVVAENGQLRAELAVVKLSRDGYMNRSNELIARVKWLKKKLEKVEAAHV